MIDNLTRLQTIVGKHLRIDPVEIKPESDFVKELGADSLDVVELVMAIEDEFELDIQDQEVSKVKTVQDVLDYLESN